MRFAVVLLALAACSNSDSSSSSTSSSGGTDASSSSSSSSSSSGGPDGSLPDAGETPVDSGVDAGKNGLVLTSTAFVEGGMIPQGNTCTSGNKSPPLAWTGVPAGIKSFAVTLVDMTNGLVHAVSYDIPSTASSLPAAVANLYAPPSVAGMHQTTAYDNSTFGYLGPCPPAQHTYVFTLYALDVATLPGATMTTTRDQAVAIIGAHKLGFAQLSGTYKKP